MHELMIPSDEGLRSAACMHAKHPSMHEQTVCAQNIKLLMNRIDVTTIAKVLTYIS